MELLVRLAFLLAFAPLLAGVSLLVRVIRRAWELKPHMRDLAKGP